MQRETLEALTISQLRKETRRYRLSSTGSRNGLIDTIMSHLERHGPADKMLGGRGNEAGSQDDVESQSEKGAVSASSLQHVLMTVTNLIKEHQQDMLAQQRQQFAQLMELLTMVRGGAQSPSAES